MQCITGGLSAVKRGSLALAVQHKQGMNVLLKNVDIWLIHRACIYVIPEMLRNSCSPIHLPIDNALLSVVY